VPAEIGLGPHRPVPASQMPSSWQTSAGGQVTGLPPTQVPAPSQASVCVQEFWSLQAVPLGFGTSVTQAPD